MKFEELENCVIDWADDRGIYQHSTLEAQFLKAVSEMGELADALAKKDYVAAIDAIGDVMVCMINVCAFLDLTPTQCLDAAWRVIKDRKGHMVAGGVFIKEDA